MRGTTYTLLKNKRKYLRITFGAHILPPSHQGNHLLLHHVMFIQKYFFFIFFRHNSHFRMPHDPESVDKAELKLTVLW